MPSALIERSLRPQTGEENYFDSLLTLNTTGFSLVQVGSPLFDDTLTTGTGIQTGSGISNKIGRSIFLKYITLRGTFWRFTDVNEANTSSSGKRCFMRFMFYVDTSHNQSATFTAINSAVLSSSTAIAPTFKDYNPSGRTRYPMKYDKNFDLTPYGVEVDEKDNEGRINQIVVHKFDLKLDLHNLPIQYAADDTTGPVNNIISNLPYFTICCDTGEGDWLYTQQFVCSLNMRTYFSNHLNGPPPVFRAGILIGTLPRKRKSIRNYRSKVRLQRPKYPPMPRINPYKNLKNYNKLTI